MWAEAGGEESHLILERQFIAHLFFNININYHNDFIN